MVDNRPRSQYNTYIAKQNAIFFNTHREYFMQAVIMGHELEAIVRDTIQKQHPELDNEQLDEVTKQVLNNMIANGDLQQTTVQ